MLDRRKLYRVLSADFPWNRGSSIPGIPRYKPRNKRNC